MSAIVGGKVIGGFYRAKIGSGNVERSAAVHRHLVFLLTSLTDARLARYMSKSGVSHDFGVCMIEVGIMARGKKTAPEGVNGGVLPRFIDVRLSQEQRAEFKAASYTPQSLALFLEEMCASGYRVGCAYSGERGSFTVSFTCRDDQSPNHNLCMTSFAGDLLTAIALACFKHSVVTEGVWVVEGDSAGGEWG